MSFDKYPTKDSIELTASQRSNHSLPSKPRRDNVPKKGFQDFEEDTFHYIHEVAGSGNVEELGNILKTGINPNITDHVGKTPLHYCVSIECSCVTCVNDAEACTRLLVATHGIDVNAQDDAGNTPLHVATEHQLARCVEILISAGADVCLIRSDSGEEPVSLLAKKLPDTMTYLLNECIFVDEYDPCNDKCVLKVDFSPIVGYPEFRATDGKTSSLASHDGLHMSWQREMRLLQSLLRNPMTASGSKILTHPVVQIFMEQKWRKVKKYFWCSFLFYIFYVILYTSYIIDVYLVNCPCTLFSKAMQQQNVTGSQMDDVNSKKCVIVTGLSSEVAVILVSTAILVVLELCKIVITPKFYAQSLMNLGTWILIGLVISTTVPNLAKQTEIGAYQYQAAAFTVFLVWTFILQQISRFPALGKYIEIFGQVLKSFGFFLVTFISVFVAFALSFSILFPTSSPFSFFAYSVLKVFVMMIGEIDYQDMFYSDDNGDVTGPIMGHLLYASFVFIVSIVLMNLVIGLTVKDIQELQDQGELRRTQRLILEMFHLESFIFSSRLPRPLGDKLKASISVLYPTKHGREGLTFAFLPNSRKDKTVPEHLKQEALNLASISFEKFRSQRCSKMFTMAHSEGMSGLGGNTRVVPRGGNGGIVVGIDHHQQPSYYSSSSSSPSSFKSSSLEAHSLDVPGIGAGGTLGTRKNSSVMTAPPWTSSSSQR